MGTRTWTRRGVLTAAGRRRAGMVGQTLMSGDDIDKALADAFYSLEMQMNIYAGEDGIRSLLADNDDAPRSGRNYNALFDELGLDPTSDEDIALVASLIGAFGDNSGILPKEEKKNPDSDEDEFEPPLFRVELKRVNGDPTLVVTYATTVAESTRVIQVRDDRIFIVNNTFLNGGESLEGQGIVMLMRQTLAARQLSARMGGKPVEVMVDALSDLSGDWIGAQIWPKMGYTFELDKFNNPSITDEVRRQGFRSANTADLMTERNDQGTLGYDVWPSIVNRVLQDEDKVQIRGRMTPTNDADIGVQLMMEYGRKKSLIKEGMPPSAKGMSDIFYLSDADDQQLRNAWLALAQARGK
jgi:hypothetical protein